MRRSSPWFHAQTEIQLAKTQPAQKSPKNIMSLHDHVADKPPAQHTMIFSIAQAAQQITRTFPTDHEIWTWEDLQAVVIDLFLTPTNTFADSYCDMSRHNQPWPCSPAWQDTTSHRRNIGGAAPTNTCRLTKLGMSQNRGPIDIIDSWRWKLVGFLCTITMATGNQWMPIRSLINIYGEPTSEIIPQFNQHYWLYHSKNHQLHEDRYT